MTNPTNPSLWRDDAGDTPPVQWQAVQEDGRFWWSQALAFADGTFIEPIEYIGGDISGTLEFAWQILEAPSSGNVEFFYSIDGGSEVTVNLGSAVATGTQQVTIDGTASSFTWGIRGTDFGDLYTGTVAVRGPEICSYNCACETDPEAKTLAECRQEMLVLTGYGAQVAHPPPGIAAKYNAFLRTAQGFLFRKYRPLQTERFFSWVLTPGVRYYGLWDNGNCCSVRLDRYMVRGAWIQDLNNVWWPLIWGIQPVFYTLDQNFGWPNYIELRQCIELFPAPQAAYTLWIKGHFGLLPFDDDADVTTLAADPVINWATYLAKRDKGQKDAEDYAAMAIEQVSALIAGTHQRKRYIPGTAEIPTPTPPIMTHFES